VSPRPYWKGYLKLSLVSCPIAVHAACSSSERVSSRQINRKTGNRLRQQLVDEQTREPVDGSDKARGYEIGKGQFLLIEDEELEAIEIESTHTIEIDSFVPRVEIDQRFFDTPYYITATDPVGQEAFAVIREAMRSKHLVALGRIVLSKRERVIALEAYGKGLIGTTLHYPYEVRDAENYFADIPELAPAPELLRLAAQILDSKLAAFDPSSFRDRYEEALMAHLKAKQAGMPPQPKQSWAVPRRAINLMEALRCSIAADNKPDAAHRAPATRKRA
jgi:DNA end-binding protein Ku